MKNQMKCFISLPIAGKEYTVFERANKAKEELKVKDVIIGYTGPVIGSHSGPGTMAIFTLGKNRD